MQTATMHAAIQATKRMVMALEEGDTGSTANANTPNTGEVHRTRDSRSTLRQQALEWKA